MLKLIHSYQNSENHSLLSSYQFKSSIDERFENSQQQDVQESFTEVCNRFQNILEPYFYFTIQIKQKCLNSYCKQKYNTTQSEIASSTQVVIENKPYHFHDILTNYSKWNDTDIKCKNCKSDVQGKNILDLSTNKYLVLQFQLFKYYQHTQSFSKNTNFLVNDVENGTLNYYGYNYHAIGGIFHKGDSLNQGHYTALVLRNNNWYYTEDHKIQKVNWKTNNITEIQNSNLYLLFLERNE